MTSADIETGGTVSTTAGPPRSRSGSGSIVNDDSDTYAGASDVHESGSAGTTHHIAYLVCVLIIFGCTITNVVHFGENIHSVFTWKSPCTYHGNQTSGAISGPTASCGTCESSQLPPSCG